MANDKSTKKYFTLKIPVPKMPKIKPIKIISDSTKQLRNDLKEIKKVYDTEVKARKLAEKQKRLARMQAQLKEDMKNFKVKSNKEG